LLELIKKSDGVWTMAAGMVLCTPQHVSFLREMAPFTSKRRARILIHREGDKLHEMLIAFCAGSTIEMHSHEAVESLYVIDGRLIVHFDGDPSLGLSRGDFLRIPAGVRHQPEPVSDCVILETALK